MPSDKAVVFLENHDTQHSCGLSYRDGNVFRVANVWMLAQPYGYPSILSSYAFVCPGENSMGPPSDGNGWTTAVTCPSSWATVADDEWVCEHRDPYILGMVAFRKLVAGTDINSWWDNGANAIAFSRGTKGFVAINRESVTVDTTVTTGMPAGSYCDILTGGKVSSACVGTSVAVDSSNMVHFHLTSNTAIAIDAATKLP
jgi:alpha-amylase